MAVTQTAERSDIEPKPLAELSAFQRDLLLIVNELDTANGSTIKDEVEDGYDQEIAAGRLYPNLDRLAEKGMIEKGKRNERSNEYRISRRGRRALIAHQGWMADHGIGTL